MLPLIFFIILLALVFDFLNGFHDAANSIATIVSTRVLTPSQAVVWAAFFNFVAAFVLGTKVAGTISKDLIDPHVVDVYVVCGGLVGAIVWNIITWLLALPTSSSHALASSLAGAAVAKNGFSVLLWQGWWTGWGGLILFIFLAPVIGFILGSAIMVGLSWLLRKSTPHKVDRNFRRLQLVSAGIYSLGHGGNDAQKTMGIIVLLLTAGGYAKYTTPNDTGWMHSLSFSHVHTVAWWIIILCHSAIALGTMFGGWRIVKTMGSGITRLQPIGGFCAETAAAATIIGATLLGVPISTTHAITGSILGVGTTRRVRSVRWIWGERIIFAWVLTLPCGAMIGALTYLLLHLTVAHWIPVH